jgi:hypothetical protein
MLREKLLRSWITIKALVMSTCVSHSCIRKTKKSCYIKGDNRNLKDAIGKMGIVSDANGIE